MTPSFQDPKNAEPDIEETLSFTPKFGPDGLIPAIAVDASDGQILMVAWMNEDALRRTLETRQAHYWSRSRKALWRKGETSGHTQKIIEIRTDCDQDVLQLIVEQTGPACHTKRPSCFYRKIELEPSGDGYRLTMLEQT